MGLAIHDYPIKLKHIKPDGIFSRKFNDAGINKIPYMKKGSNKRVEVRYYPFRSPS